MSGRPDRALASMGIYVFNAAYLYETLLNDFANARSNHDFGRDVIPATVRLGHAVAHPFSQSCVSSDPDAEPYWRDVGTIDAYWESNLDLCGIDPSLDLYDTNWPIWTYQEQLPPAKFVFDDDGRRGMAVDSVVSGGCIISGAKIARSLLFSNVHVHSYSSIEDSVILPDVEVHQGVRLKRVVVEKRCTLPEGLAVGFDPAEDRKRFVVSERGITLITPEMLGQEVLHQR